MDPRGAQRLRELPRRDALHRDALLERGPPRGGMLDFRLIRACPEIGGDRFVNARRHRKVELTHDREEFLACLVGDTHIEALFLADAAHSAALVIVPRVDQDLLVELEQLLGDAVPQRLGAAVLEIRPPAAADQQSIAGE